MCETQRNPKNDDPFYCWIGKPPTQHNDNPKQNVDWVERQRNPTKPILNLSDQIYNNSMRYRRIFQPGGTYFFTLVTCNRQNIFREENAKIKINLAVDTVRKRHPFSMISYVILPDHIHMIMTLPINDSDFPTRLRLIKSTFTRHWTEKEMIPVTPSRSNKHERMIWQRRYWEHLIRNEEDLVRHIEYIHYNPVKHEYSQSPYEWGFSSFKDFVKDGIYNKNWGANAIIDLSCYVEPE